MDTNMVQTRSSANICRHCCGTRYVFIPWLERMLVEREMRMTEIPGDIFQEIPVELPEDIPSHEEIVKILNGIETVTRVGKRRKAILELLYSTGIRANELLNLETFDINSSEREILIRQGKFNKDRKVPYGECAARALQDYVDNARKYYAARTGATKLFVSAWGTKLKYKELLLVMPRRANGQRLRAHSLRHACAIGMLKNGADIRYIQELLGHVNITTTQIYTRILPKHIQEVHTKYHPRARIKKPASFARGPVLQHSTEILARRNNELERLR